VTLFLPQQKATINLKHISSVIASAVAAVEIKSECKITAGHWPISDHFSERPIKMLAWCIHFVHMANQIHVELEKWLTISNFLFCTLQIDTHEYFPRIKKAMVHKSVLWMT